MKKMEKQIIEQNALDSIEVSTSIISSDIIAIRQTAFYHFVEKQSIPELIKALEKFVNT